MSGGEWRIRQHPPSGHGGWLTERITVENDEPKVTLGWDVMLIEYADGRQIMYPHANIVRAEYRPHPQP